VNSRHMHAELMSDTTAPCGGELREAVLKGAMCRLDLSFSTVHITGHPQRLRRDRRAAVAWRNRRRYCGSPRGVMGRRNWASTLVRAAWIGLPFIIMGALVGAELGGATLPNFVLAAIAVPVLWMPGHVAQRLCEQAPVAVARTSLHRSGRVIDYRVYVLP